MNMMLCVDLPLAARSPVVNRLVWDVLNERSTPRHGSSDSRSDRASEVSGLAASGNLESTVVSESTVPPTWIPPRISRAQAAFLADALANLDDYGRQQRELV